MAASDLRDSLPHRARPRQHISTPTRRWRPASRRSKSLAIRRSGRAALPGPWPHASPTPARRIRRASVKGLRLIHRRPATLQRARINGLRIIGWALADHMRAHLVVNALQKALNSRQNLSAGLIFHTDQAAARSAACSADTTCARACQPAPIRITMPGVNRSSAGSRPRCFRMAPSIRLLTPKPNPSPTSMATTTPAADTHPSATLLQPPSRPFSHYQTRTNPGPKKTLHLTM